MMKLFVPACGDRLRLTAPWSFSLYLERRNLTFAKNLGLVPKNISSWGLYEGEPYRSALKRVPVFLPEGTLIECARVYIRQFNKGRVQLEKDYDSITWSIAKLTGKANKGKPFGRFWVKLPDCYNIEYELEPDSLYRDRVKVFKQVHNS